MGFLKKILKKSVSFKSATGMDVTGKTLQDIKKRPGAYLTGKVGSDEAAKFAGQTAARIFGKNSWAGRRILAQTHYEGDKQQWLPGRSAWIGRIKGANKEIKEEDAIAAQKVAAQQAHDEEVQRYAREMLGPVALRRRRGIAGTAIAGASRPTLSSGGLLG